MLATVRVVVLADTHAPRRWRRCPPAVAEYLRGADLILHAGDVCTAGVLDELSGYAPVRVVRGNNDGPDVAAWGAPETLELDLAGLAAAMVHDSGPAGRLRAFAHTPGPGRRWHPHLQSRVADRPPPPAAGHLRPAAHRRRPPGRGADHPRDSDRLVRTWMWPAAARNPVGRLAAQAASPSSLRIV